MRQARGAGDQVDKAGEYENGEHAQAEDGRRAKGEKAPARGIDHAVPGAKARPGRGQQNEVERDTAHGHLPELRPAPVLAHQPHAAERLAQRAPAGQVLDEDEVDKHAGDVDKEDAPAAAHAQRGRDRHGDDRAQRP